MIKIQSSGLSEDGFWIGKTHKSGQHYCLMVNLYDSVGKKIGWNFSNISPIVKNKKWSYYDVVRRLAKKSDMVLDIGTGGGEILLKIVLLEKILKL